MDLVLAASAGEMQRREIYPRLAFSLFFYGECLDDAGDVERPTFQGRQPLLRRLSGGGEEGLGRVRRMGWSNRNVRSMDMLVCESG